MTILHFETREEWLKYRMMGIGGSDAPVIAGLVGWSSPYKLCLQKKGLIPEEEETTRMSLGKIIEPWARQRLAEETGWTIETLVSRMGHTSGEAVVQSDTQPWMFCTPDAIITPSGDFVVTTPDGPIEHGHGVLEIKSVGYVTKEALEDPDSDERRVWDTQMHHSLAATGFKWGVVAVIIGNHTFRWYTVTRDKKKIAELTARESIFWANLQRGEYPEPDGTDATDGAIRERFKRPNGKPVSLSSESVLDFEEFDLFSRQSAETGLKAAKAKQRLMAAMGENTFAVLPNGVKLSWKADARGARVLRRVK